MHSFEQIVAACLTPPTRSVMDGSRFDALVKSLGVASRRGLVAGTGAVALSAVFGRGGPKTALAMKKKGKGKGKKKKKGCRGQRCGAACIPAKACCTSAQQGTWIAEGATVGQCGLCLGGRVTKDPVDCLLIDPDGCTVCDDSFACVPAPDGTLCEGCGRCNGGLCENPDEAKQCGDNTCCPETKPVCVDQTTGLCCEERRACGSKCCKDDSGFGLQDGETCTREGCCPEVKAASNCRADHPFGTPCTEKICCDQVWPGEGRGRACLPGAGVSPDTRGYCCGPTKSCCFTGCCPDGSSCCGDRKNCCPDGVACGSEACFDPVPDHV
jgi:hypothetical protein